MSVNSGALQASAEMGHSAARQRSADKPLRTGVLAGLVASHSRAQRPGQPVATRPTAPPVCEKAMLQRSLTGKFLFQGFIWEVCSRFTGHISAWWSDSSTQAAARSIP